MKISIITPCLNSGETIARSIDSVLRQENVSVEYIIIDGKSSDGTCEIVRSYGDKITTFVSEPDKGIYNAINKGIGFSRGEIIGIHNADDMYADSHVLEDVARLFVEKKADIVYGDIAYVKRVDLSSVTRVWRSGVFKPKKIRSGWIMPHPATFISRDAYERWGVYRDDFKIAGDYELLLRFLVKHGARVAYIPRVLAYMAEGGVSAASFAHRRAGWNELKKAWRVNELRVPLFYIFRRVFPKIRQFLFPEKRNLSRLE